MSEPFFLEQIDLKPYNTLGIGGPARYFREIHTIPQMQAALHYCFQQKIRFMILGKGSNCLFDDLGFNGAVLLNKIDFLNQPAPGTFHVGAGYSFSLLGAQTARAGWSGLEFASGIPASVGGAVWMNAGANGQETRQCLESVEFVNQHGELECYLRDSMHFAYRTSPFQRQSGAIVAATFVLQQSQGARKKQLEIIDQRKKTQPLNAKSAGCIFLNPEGEHAGALIEQCGLKGISVGGAAVSNVHANFLINAENASCLEMLRLIRLVQLSVKDKTGLELKSEVRRIPYDQEEACEEA